MEFSENKLEWNGRRIVFAHFPEHVDEQIGGVSGVDETSYYILINGERSPVQQCRALGHELAHIYLDHHFMFSLTDMAQYLLRGRNVGPVWELEREANRRAWEFYRAYRDGKLPVQPSIVSRDIESYGKNVPYSYEMRYLDA